MRFFPWKKRRKKKNKKKSYRRGRFRFRVGLSGPEHYYFLFFLITLVDIQRFKS